MVLLITRRCCRTNFPLCSKFAAERGVRRTTAVITRATLTHELKSLGVQTNETLMVHAGLRKVGPVEGGADALLDALLEVVGSEGTLLMVLGADADVPFDAQESPAEAGMAYLPKCSAAALPPESTTMQQLASESAAPER
ncbi:AAC(3) family N-acetyltransferase [Billgrantia saliphila]|uniref:AAC(3) family N-acetyltransferase n=1 Tax=Billgrantia saliphila TaxID=1848458 RepID=UPI000CE4CE13